MKRLFVSAAIVLATFMTASAAVNPLWLRKNSISPDGSRIAFCYQGDIFTVSTDGGEARRITSNPAYDTDPLWTPDGQSIVFSSYREKSKDIYIISCEGGTPERLTTYPGNETPLAVLSDGSILFSANIQQDASFGEFPGNAQLYIIGRDGGRPQLVTSLPMASLSVSRNGSVLYEDIKGYEDPFRKHHTSSVTRDIWLYTPKSPLSDKHRPALKNFGIDAKGSFKQISAFNGEDRNPVFTSDGDKFYYLSEQDGTFNIYRSSISAPAKSEQITYMKGNPVRYLSISDNGTLAYSYDGELYVIKDGGQPAKVNITLTTDPIERERQELTISSGARDIAVSPNDKEIAFIARGDVYVTSIDYKTTRRITNTPEQERDVCFSEDGRTLYYSSERDGHWGIYATTLTEKDDKYFTYSVKMKEKLVTDKKETCFQPLVSPDGKWLAFLRNRTEIVVMNIKGSAEKTVLPASVNYSYADGDQSFCWSPDSRYILCNYQANGGWNNEDVALIEVATKKITDLTESGYTDSNFKWALKGKAMAWQSDKAGYRSHGSWGAEDDIYLMFFDGKAYQEFRRDKEAKEIAELLKVEDKKEKTEEKDTTKTDKKKEDKLELDLENRKDRTVRLTDLSGRLGDFHVTADGKTLYYIAYKDDGASLYKMDLEEGDISVVQKGVSGSIYPTKDDKYFFILSGRGISRISTASGSSKSVTFSGDYEYRPVQEREYIFNHIWKQVEEKFYDPEIHGIDWAGYRETYAKFLPYINNNFDFQEMLSEMLGELNGSHTGARYYTSRPSFGTLGVLYDNEYKGDGLKIKEVLKGGVLATEVPDIKAGDVILAIDGKEIKAGEDWYQHFASKGGKRLLLTIKKGAKKEDVFVVAAYSDRNELYRRWVRQREEMVRELSGGKIAYVHVQGMDSGSFREVFSNLLGKYRGCDAVIVDTRHNGGGWLHDDLATLLNGKAYIKYQPRGQYIGTDPHMKWTKPSCVLIGEDNYSDASGFPYVYRTLGIGKLIGAPVPGTMTAVWWENQIDPTLVFGIPQVGAYGIKEGRYLENLQIEPDIRVYNTPESLLEGKDLQLEAAVREMMRETGNIMKK